MVTKPCNAIFLFYVCIHESEINLKLNVYSWKHELSMGY